MKIEKKCLPLLDDIENDRVKSLKEKELWKQ